MISQNHIPFAKKQLMYHKLVLVQMIVMLCVINFNPVLWIQLEHDQLNWTGHVCSERFSLPNQNQKLYIQNISLLSSQTSWTQTEHVKFWFGLSKVQNRTIWFWFG